LSNTRPLHKIGVFLCVALFVVGLVRLFWLRFEAGDLYPPYSSLRSDPLGVQALYEGIQYMEGQEASRNFRPLDQFTPAPGITFMVCGLTGIPSTADDPWKALLEKVTKGGGRLVISVAGTSPALREEKEDVNDTGDGSDDPPEETPPETSTLELTLCRRPLDETSGDQAVRGEIGEAHGLPNTLVFRSPLFFEPGDPSWETLFFFEDEAVVVRRAWGDGDVVMVADSYLFSNEALRHHRFPDFLAWVIGDGPVVFDEYHHGLARQPGISTLIRKYRLHGVVLSLAALVALLIWQRAVVFAPRPAGHDQDGDSFPGADAAGGWVGLMRRHIAPGDLLAVCYTAWKKSTAADRFTGDQVEQVRDRINRQGEDPVSAYQSICELLKRGKTP
jgi:hypothetical protein